MHRLLERRERLLRKLSGFEELLRGSIIERSMRCGRSGCHCADGPGHPATYLSTTLGVGKTKQISLPATLVVKARRGVASYEACWEILEEISAINRELLRLEREALRSKVARDKGGGEDGKSGRKTSRGRGRGKG